MSIIVHDPAYEWLPDEKSVTLYRGKENDSIHIHPWHRVDRDNQPYSQVSVSCGELKKSGEPRDGDWSEAAIGLFDREDFVEALLAVFPELKRAES